jgi:hypothetical protein
MSKEEEAPNTTNQEEAANPTELEEDATFGNIGAEGMAK